MEADLNISAAGKPTTGLAVDGYLQLSKVTCDANGNGTIDDDESFTYTLLNGTFSFPNGCKFGLIVTGGTNADTGLAFTGELRGPAGTQLVTPLTTLVVGGVTEDQLILALGLAANTEVLSIDPAASNGEVLRNPELFKRTLVVQQVIHKLTELSVGLANDQTSESAKLVYAEVAKAMAVSLGSGVRLISESGNFDAAAATQLFRETLGLVLSSSKVSLSVTSAISSAGGAALLPNVIAEGFKSMADPILAAGNLSGLTAITKERQLNTNMTVTVKNALEAGTLNSNISPQDATALGRQVAIAVNAPPPPPAPSQRLLLTFDESPAIFTDIGAYGGAEPFIEAAPSNGTGNALKVIKPISTAAGGGVYFGVAAIPFTAVQKTITARVYASQAGALIKLKVEASDQTSYEAFATTATGAAASWQTLTWEVPGVNPDKIYSRIAITPDPDTSGSGQTYYFDDLTLSKVPTPLPPVLPGTLLLSFDEFPPAFKDMGAYPVPGNAMPSVLTGPHGATANVLKILKPDQTPIGGGTYFGVDRIPFTDARKTITARVFSTVANAVIHFKVEVTQVDRVEVFATMGEANTWQTVTWSFPRVDPSKSYKTIAITPDKKLLGSGQIYYIDDITLAP